ncbi:TolC family protein [Fontisphaera persica]|uniref:TolC family protein n=1 Tax=Fontisphaera persica TaxID=2974023 RepID=UPI0024BF3713|nr:TolC family protein [Fontisphaera persica]WCJ59324.1 TolC family protein [Fontisphaera persica]
MYRSIQQTQQRVLKKTNDFSIDTPWSSRKPESVQPPELIESRLETNRLVLSVQEALDLAVKNSREYQDQKESLYSSALALARERYKYQPRLFATGEWALRRRPDGSRDGTLSASSGANLTQLLASGGRLGLTLANDLFRYYTGDPRRTAVSSVSVNLVQPLFQAFGNNNDAIESLTQAERNLVYAVRNFSQFQEQFALNVLNDYFNILAQKDAVRNNYANYLSRVAQTQRLEARAVDRQTRTEVDQARQSELSAKNSYINAVARYQTLLDSFKIRLGLPLSTKLYLDDKALEEIAQVGLIPVTLDAEEAYRLATQRHLPTLNAIDRFQDVQRRVRLARDKLKPNLTFIADASLESERPTDWTRFDARRASAGVGLELDLPLDRKNQRFAYREALIAFEAQIRSLTLTFDNLRNNIENGLRTIEQQRQTYLIQKKAVELAKVRVESTTMNLQAGNVAVRDVLEAQDALIAAQNQLTLSLVSYQQARLRLMLDIGALDTSKEKFWIQDHLVGFLPKVPEAGPVETEDKPVLPPDDYFNQ